MPFILLQSKQHSVAITILKIYGYALGSHFLHKVHKHTNYNHKRKGKDTIILARFDSFFNNSIELVEVKVKIQRRKLFAKTM